MKKYVEIGQRALRGPDGTFLPACQIYILKEDAEAAGLQYEEEDEVMEGIVPILVLKYSDILKQRRKNA